jgi:uncharacterized protein YjbJ (UPF0337 family)
MESPMIKENLMGTQDKASNKVQDLKGKAEETVGKITGDEDLEDEGKVDQAKAAVKDVGENIKDTASKVKDAVTGK